MDYNNPHDVLKKYWGFNTFREGQYEIVQSILSHRDTLAILPTGGGKSICYQVPAIMQEGCTLIISPLIALMQNQVDRLRKSMIHADLIHSNLKNREVDLIIDNVRNGNTKMLYVSPERATQDRFIKRLNSTKISFIAVDEAHCISQWGFDFRPCYLDLKKIRETIQCPILAVTATATLNIRKDIIDFLELRNENVFFQTSARKNLSLSVKKEENKIQQLAHILPKFTKSGLIYFRNRRLTVETVDILLRHNVLADAYHAGLDYPTRKKRFDSWMSNKIQYMCCTTAFGMGIDKSDVGLVVHMELPVSLEEYYQEVGRAGRDGSKAYGLLLYNDRDIRRLLQIFENAFPTLEEIQHVYKCICLFLDFAEGSRMERSLDFNFDLFCKRFKLSAERSSNAFKILVQSGWIYTNPGFHQRSRVYIKASQEELKSYYLLNKEYQLVCVSMLRNYEGILSNPVSIQETVIAFQTQIPIDRIKKILQYLHNESLLEYIPQTESPQLQILQERVHSKNIYLDQEWVEFRKQILKKQIESVLQFINTSQCRQEFVLKYFGEEKTSPCGICDNCLKLAKPHITPDIRDKWRMEIYQLFQLSDRISIRNLYQYFPSNKSHWVDTLLQELLGEKKLGRDGDDLYLIVKGNIKE